MAPDETPRRTANANYTVNPLHPDVVKRVSAIYARQRARTPRQTPQMSAVPMQVGESEAQMDDQQANTPGSSSGSNVATFPENYVCVINDMTYGINLRTGQNWQIDEVEMSEVEVEAEVQGELLDAAREIVRTEGFTSGQDFNAETSPQAAGTPVNTHLPLQGSSMPGGFAVSADQPLPDTSQASQERSLILFRSARQSPDPVSKPASPTHPAESSDPTRGGGQPYTTVPPTYTAEGSTHRGSVTPRPGNEALPRVDKGKYRAVEPYSDEEEIPQSEADGDAEMVDVGGSPAPRNGPRQGGLAIEDVILRLHESFQTLSRDIVEEVRTALRRGNVGDDGSIDYVGDDESDVPRRQIRKPKSKAPGIKRREVTENELSAHIRLHMRSLIPTDDWLKDTVSEQDITDWTPGIRECCTADTFKLHLAGTPCDPWNESATRVFTNDFLAKNSDTYPSGWAVREMALKKTRAYIKTLIVYFRDNTKSQDVRDEKRRAKSRQERKANLFHRRRDVTFSYPQMEPQRRMLEQLGIDGMSSDEEEIVREGVQYRICPPRWRAPMLMGWLRTFDALYMDRRTGDDSGDRRGNLPRRRIATRLESPSKKFVPGLPINAYRGDWLEEQLDVENLVHPTPECAYLHDPHLVELAYRRFGR